MFGIETLSGTAHAVAIVGLVLVEAMLLYVGYGALEGTLGARLTSVLRGQCRVAAALTGQCPEQESSA